MRSIIRRPVCCFLFPYAFLRALGSAVQELAFALLPRLRVEVLPLIPDPCRLVVNTIAIEIAADQQVKLGFPVHFRE
jgi:hypothetical protein